MTDMIITYVSPYSHILSIVGAFVAGLVFASYIRISISVRKDYFDS